MPTRTFLDRSGRAEESIRAQSLFFVDCICFPEKERPFFGFAIEMEIAGKVKCPLHGERFKPLFHLYVPNTIYGHRDRRGHWIGSVFGTEQNKGAEIFPP
jgi:hypothetical protein